jgi:hypothetical protein
MYVNRSTTYLESCFCQIPEQWRKKVLVIEIVLYFNKVWCQKNSTVEYSNFIPYTRENMYSNVE